MSHRITCTVLLTLPLACFALPAVSNAVPLVVDAGSEPVRNNGSSNFGGVVGYRFTVDTDDIFLSQLGAWDGPGTASSPNSGTVGDGLEEAAEVGFWRESDMALLASATVPVGTAGLLIDDFRYVPVPQVELFQGVGYVIGTLVSDGGNAFVNSFEPPEGDAEFSNIITAVDSRFLAGGSLVFPTSDSGNPALDGFAGPNAILTIVPEPASCTLMLFGLAPLLKRGRRTVFGASRG